MQRIEKIDATIAGATVGSAVASGVANKIIPEDLKQKIVQKKDALSKNVEVWKEKNSRIIWVLEFLMSTLNLLFYFLDVTTDINLAINFQRSSYPLANLWYKLTVAFVALPYFVALLGIFLYLKKDLKYGMCDLCLLIPILPFGPIFCDMIMPFYRVFRSCLPGKLLNFMVQYEATRTLSETVLESLPQLCLQIYIAVHCEEITCVGVDKETGSALLQSIIVGVFSIIFHIATTWKEMQGEGLTLRGYLKSLIEMGAGLPLAAITSDTIETMEIKYILTNSQLNSLSVALRENKSMRSMNLKWETISHDNLLKLLETKHEAITNSTMLIVAVCRQSNDDAVALILDNGININFAEKHEGMTALHFIVNNSFNSVSYLKRVLKHPEIDINVKDKYGNTALFQAAMIGNVSCTHLLCSEDNIDVNAQNLDEQTALFIAIDCGNVECVQILANHPKLDLSITTKEETALSFALRIEHNACAQILKEKLEPP
jgi:hypothetical protein